MVGNSLRSDIDPARRCGVKAIWIDAHVWEYEQKDVDQAGEGIWRATRITEVIDIISAGGRPSGRRDPGMPSVVTRASYRADMERREPQVREVQISPEMITKLKNVPKRPPRRHAHHIRVPELALLS